MSDNKEKLKALQLTLDKLDKTYGKGTVMRLSDERVSDIPAISSGSLGLDISDHRSMPILLIALVKLCVDGIDIMFRAV